MSYEPQQPRPDYRSGGAGGYHDYDTHPRTGSSGPQNDEKTVAVLTHLSGPIAALISVGWLGFVGPLVVWFIYKDKSLFLRAAAAGSFNFNVTLWIINVIGWICVVTVILIPVGVILIIAYWILLLVCHIVAAVRANNGEVYRYPLQLPILR